VLNFLRESPLQGGKVYIDYEDLQAELRKNIEGIRKAGKEYDPDSKARAATDIIADAFQNFSNALADARHKVGF
jgi:hypothetical protein